MSQVEMEGAYGGWVPLMVYRIQNVGGEPTIHVGMLGMYDGGGLGFTDLRVSEAQDYMVNRGRV